jgi:hypothetical protein
VIPSLFIAAAIAFVLGVVVPLGLCFAVLRIRGEA